VHDYKLFNFRENQHVFEPDYYCNKHIINSPEEDLWIHYMSHELVGLKKAELEEYYFKEDDELREALDILDKK
jgi:hypothetical protein